MHSDPSGSTSTVVAGVASGLGRTYALRLAKPGADVAVVDLRRRGPSASDAIAYVPGQVISVGGGPHLFGGHRGTPH